jgi:hypothetical protein
MSLSPVGLPAERHPRRYGPLEHEDASEKYALLCGWLRSSRGAIVPMLAYAAHVLPMP